MELPDMLMALGSFLQVGWWPDSFRVLYREKNGRAHSVFAWCIHVCTLLLEIVAAMMLGLYAAAATYAFHLTCTLVFLSMVIRYRRAQDERERAG